MSLLLNTAKKVIGANDVKCLPISELVEKYPNGITINGVTIRDFPKSKNIPCFMIAEDKNICFKATSTVLNALYRTWLETFDDDIYRLNEELANENVKIKITSTKSEAGFKYWNVAILCTINSETGEITE